MNEKAGGGGHRLLRGFRGLAERPSLDHVGLIVVVLVIVVLVVAIVAIVAS